MKFEKNNIKQYIIYFILIIVIIVCSVIIYKKLTANTDVFYEIENADTGYGVSYSKSDDKIKVDIEGAVKKPGLKTLNSDEDRLDDAIKAAKGLKRFADTGQINLAMKIYDGMKIVIPEYGEELIVEGGNNKKGGFAGKVNVNTASITELQQLPGIGPAYAQRIVDYRESIGMFRCPEDLLEIKGIGEKRLDSIRDNITF